MADFKTVNLSHTDLRLILQALDMLRDSSEYNFNDDNHNLLSILTRLRNHYGDLNYDRQTKK